MRTRLFVILALLLALLLASQAMAAVDSVDVLIKTLVEKGIITEDDAASVRAEIAVTRQDEEAARKSYPVTSKRPLKVSGYVQERFTHYTQPGANDTLETRRLRLAFAGDATPNVDYYILTDLAGSRTGVTSVSQDSKSKVSAKTGLFSKPTLLDATIGYKLSGDRKLSFGQFKVPFGQENLVSDAALDTINRSTVTESLVPGRDNGAVGRDVGIQLGGVKVLEGGARSMEYAFGLFNGAGVNIPDDNNRKDLAGRLVWKPAAEGLTLGASYYNGRAGAAHAVRNRTGLEGVYLLGPWTLKSEYIWGTDAAVKKKGWYATLFRPLGSDTQGVVRYDAYDPNTLALGDAVKTLTLGLNWFLNKDGYTRVQLNYEQHREETKQVPNDLLLAQFQAGF